MYVSRPSRLLWLSHPPPATCSSLFLPFGLSQTTCVPRWSRDNAYLGQPYPWVIFVPLVKANYYYQLLVAAVLAVVSDMTLALINVQPITSPSFAFLSALRRGFPPLFAYRSEQRQTAGAMPIGMRIHQGEERDIIGCKSISAQTRSEHEIPQCDVIH